MAKFAARSRLHERPATDRPHAQSRAPYAAVERLGGTSAQRPSGRAAAALCRDERIDAVPPLNPCRRRRTYDDRWADRRGQVGPAHIAGPAIPALPGFPSLYLRHGPISAGGDAGDGRRASWPWRRRERDDRVPAASPHRPARRARMGRRVDRRLARARKDIDDAGGQRNRLVGADQSRHRAGRGTDADRPVAAAAIGTAALRARTLHIGRPVRSAARRRRGRSSHGRRPMLRDGSLDGIGKRRRARPLLPVPSPRRAVHRTADVARPRRVMEIYRPPAIFRAHPRMAENRPQEECRGRLCHPQSFRGCRQSNRAGPHRELPAAYPASQRPGDRTAIAGHLSPLWPQRAANRAGQPRGAEAAILSPICARQPPL